MRRGISVAERKNKNDASKPEKISPGNVSEPLGRAGLHRVSGNLGLCDQVGLVVPNLGLHPATLEDFGDVVLRSLQPVDPYPETATGGDHSISRHFRVKTRGCVTISRVAGRQQAVDAGTKNPGRASPPSCDGQAPDHFYYGPLPSLRMSRPSPPSNVGRFAPESSRRRSRP